MRVLGIDPGSTVTGYGIIEGRGGAFSHIENGVIAPGRGLEFPSRLHSIYGELRDLIERYRPETVAVESVFVAKNARSSLLLGHARGVAMLAACEAGLPTSEYSPSQVKIAVTGSGRATKDQIQRMVKALLVLPEVASEDASDALAVAICHLNSAGLEKRLKGKAK